MPNVSKIFSRILTLSFLVTAPLFLSVFTTSSAQAGVRTAERFITFAYGGNLEAGIAEFQTLVKSDPNDGEAIFGLGALQFLYAIEGLQRDLYRYGAGNQAGGIRRAAFLPVLRVPVPPNPNAETVDYAKVRGLFSRFVDRLEIANQSLSQLGDKPAKLPINIPKIGFDIDGDGKVAQSENLAGILSALSGLRRSGLNVKDVKLDIAFDTADANWLRGYSNVLMSIGNFFLSFDFEKSFDASFHVVFGNAATKFGRQLKNTKGDPEEISALKAQLADVAKKKLEAFSIEQQTRMRALRTIRRKIQRDKRLDKTQKKAERAKTDAEFKLLQAAQAKSSKINRKTRQVRDRLATLDPDSPGTRGSVQAFLDPLSFLHSISWDVVEPARLKLVRKNLLTVMRLNRETWRLVEAETDDDREWLPSPRQTGPFESLKVTQETIDAWLKTIDAAEAVLEGKLLVPSLRFGRGVNMKTFFETAQSFDLVLFLTGPNSIRYVQKGPVWDQGLMQTVNNPFGRNFGAYMIWFN